MNQHHLDPPSRGEWRAIIAITIMVFAMIGYAIYADEANAAPWKRTTSTWYGPGFYGNTTACGQRYSMSIRGVANNRYRCGTKLTLRRGMIITRVRVIDTGGFSHNFDLSARTAMDLCRCWRPYTMTHYWRYGW